MSMIICTNLWYNNQQLLLLQDFLLFDFTFLSQYNPLKKEAN